MYCYARCYFESADLCKEEYYQLKTQFRDVPTDSSICYTVYKDNHYIALYSHAPLQEDIIRMVSLSTPSSIEKPLPDSVVTTLIERRYQGISSASPLKTTQGYTYSENSTPVGYNDPEGVSDTFTLSTSSPSSPSLMYRCWLRLHSLLLTSARHTHTLNELMREHNIEHLTELSNVLRENLFTSEKYHFTDSAIEMLHSVYEAVDIGMSESYYPLPLDKAVWIEYRNPPCPDLKEVTDSLGAFYWHSDDDNPNQEGLKNEDLTEDRRFYLLEIIDSDGETRGSYQYDRHLNQWFIPSYHTCPTGDCQVMNVKEGGFMLPCRHCFVHQTIFVSLFITSLRIIRKEYALSSSPPSFSTSDRGYSEEKIEYVPSHNKARRKRGEKDKRIRQVYTPLIFHMISYEVSEISSPITAEEKEQIQTYTRENWLSTTPKGDIIYKKHHFEGLSREYHLPHYRDLIRRVQTGELSQEGDLEYTLLYNSSGSPFVRGSIRPYEKYVLFKRRDPQTTMKRVTARRYKKR